MAITIKCGSISKKKNSTYQPTDAQLSTEYNVVLKDGCSENNPVFVLNAGSFPYNYVKWDTSYYFVNDVTIERNNLLTISCSIDVLATFKSYILASSQFVLYDTTENTEISDSRLSTKTTTSIMENEAAIPFDFLGSGSCVVVNVVGKTKCTSYAMSISDATSLLNGVVAWRESEIIDMETPSIEVTDVQSAIEYLSDLFDQICQKTVKTIRQFLTNPSAADCIRSAYVIPLSLAQCPGTPVTSIELGSYEKTVSAKEIYYTSLQDGQSVTIPWPANDWRRNAPYTELYLYIPYIGNISIPVSEVIGWNSISVDYVMDVRTGETVFTIDSGIQSGKATKVIGQYCATLSGSFAIGTSEASAKNLVSTIGSAVSGIAASVVNPIAGGAAAISGMLNNATPIPTTIGNVGGGAVTNMYGTNCRCMSIFHDTIVTPDSVSPAIGTPAMAYKSLSSLTGFVQCSNAKVAAPAHSDELTQIDNYLNSGFYIE